MDGTETGRLPIGRGSLGEKTRFPIKGGEETETLEAETLDTEMLETETLETETLETETFPC